MDYQLGKASDHFADLGWQGGWLPNSRGLYKWYPAGKAPINDLGMWSVPTRANKCANHNAATNISGTLKNSAGDPGILSIVSDEAALQAAGLAQIVPGGKVFKYDNSASPTASLISIVGACGNTNPHTTSCFMRGAGNASIRLSGSVIALTPLTSDYVRRTTSQIPVDAVRNLILTVDAGGVLYFVLTQLEEGSYATDPIVTNGATQARQGTREAFSLPVPIDYGIAGFIKFNQPRLVDNAMRVFSIDSGATTDGVDGVFIYRSSTNYALRVNVGSVTLANIVIAPVAIGDHTIAFAAGPGFAYARRVGLAAPAVAAGIQWPTGLDTLHAGSQGNTSTVNNYQVTKKVDLLFGAPGQPINQAIADQTYARALAA